MTKNNYDPDNLIMDMMQVPGFLEISPPIPPFSFLPIISKRVKFDGITCYVQISRLWCVRLLFCRRWSD